MPAHAARALAIAALAVPLALLPPAGAAAQAAPGARLFRLDASHCDVGFSVGFLYGTHVRGRFDELRGTLLYDERAPERSSLTVVIGAGSLNTGSRQRDEHLRSDDFLDTGRFPALVFQSRRVERDGAGWALVGMLTVKGVAREVRVPFRETHPPQATPQGHQVLGFTGTLRIARADFGILGGARHNPWFDQVRSAAMADSVDVRLDLAWWATDFQRERDADREAAVARVRRDGGAAVAREMRAAAAARPDAFRGAEWSVLQVGRALLAEGRTSDAIAIHAVATELFPRSAAALAALGWARERAGDAPGAEATYAHALAIDPLETLALERSRRPAVRR